MNKPLERDSLIKKLGKILDAKRNPYHVINNCVIVYNSLAIDSFVSVTKLFSKTAIMDLRSKSNAMAIVVIGEPADIKEMREIQEFKALCKQAWREYVQRLAGEDIYHTIPDSIRNWFESGHIGSSALTFLNVSLGKQYRFYDGDDYTKDSPLDIHDFKRCADLVKSVPELAAHLPKMAKVSSLWAYAIEHWDHFNRQLELVDRNEVKIDEVRDEYKAGRPYSGLGLKF